MNINGCKLYKCALSASHKTLKIWKIDGNGLTANSPDTIMRITQDDVQRYIEAVRNINRLKKVDADNRDDIWSYDMQQANDNYNTAVEYILANCRKWR